MKVFKKIPILLFAVIVLITPLTVNGDDRIEGEHHEHSWHRSGGTAPSNQVVRRETPGRGHEMEHREFHRRYPDRIFVNYFPDNYVYVPESYTYCQGNYDPGYPALGSMVPFLPAGSSTLVLNGITLYFSEGVYYVQAPEGYIVVQPPC